MNLKRRIKKASDKIWEVEKNVLKYNFGLRLYQFSMGNLFDISETKLLPKELDIRKNIISKIRHNRRSSSVSKQFQRLLIGFYGVPFNFTPKRCGISSKCANNDKTKIVNDHIIGVTSCAEYVIETFCKDFLLLKSIHSWNDVDNDRIIASIDNMANNWLKDNLWLWAQCRLTREEHKGSNLKRGTSQSVDYKLQLKHYEDAGIEIVDYQ